MRNKTIRTKVAAAMLLLALLSPVTAHGQTDDFFYIEDEPKREQEYNSGSWNIFGFGNYNGDDNENNASWTGFEYGDPLPVGDGLLLLAAAGACYAAVRQRKRKETKEKRKN